MPQQFNQTKTPLKWSIGKKNFECEPWGAVDVPAELVDSCKRRGVPIAATAIAAEVRAARRKEDNVAAASDQAFQALRSEAAEAKASAKSAQEQAGELQSQVEAQAVELREKAEEAEKMSAELAEAKAEVAALSKQLEEVTKKEVAQTEKAQKARARKPKKSDAGS